MNEKKPPDKIDNIIQGPWNNVFIPENSGIKTDIQNVDNSTFKKVKKVKKSKKSIREENSAPNKDVNVGIHTKINYDQFVQEEHEKDFKHAVFSIRSININLLEILSRILFGINAKSINKIPYSEFSKIEELMKKLEFMYSIVLGIFPKENSIFEQFQDEYLYNVINHMYCRAYQQVDMEK